MSRVDLTARSRFSRILSTLLLGLLLDGCSAFPIPSSYRPVSINDVGFRDRAVSKADEDIRVTAAVPTEPEVQALFQVDLIGREIQPVWVKVENHSDQPYYLISTAIDPNHFSALEAAYAVRGGLNAAARLEMESYFRRMAFRNPILPHTAVSGFIFTNLDGKFAGGYNYNNPGIFTFSFFEFC